MTQQYPDQGYHAEVRAREASAAPAALFQMGIPESRKLPALLSGSHPLKGKPRSAILFQLGTSLQREEDG
jgi:hypothetical protein